MNSSWYPDHQYGTLRRKWFGLPKKWGGDAATGFAFGTHDPGTLTHVEKWFPEGPIEIRKCGAFMSSTSNNASGGYMNFQFLTRGASASVIATMQAASATVNEGVVAASKGGSSLTVNQCKAGEYVTIKTFEPTTPASATEVKATTSGAAAFFIDYIPKFDNDANWV
jgi:hypothetical protein